MFELINRKTYRYFLLLAILGTLVLTFSMTSGVVVVELINDKVAHGSIFFVLSFLSFHSLGRQYGLLTLVALACFGLLIEVIQYFLPWRSFSWMDWVADISGILAYELIHRLKRAFYLR